TIASTFHLHELQGARLIDTVTDYWRAKELLLILDNCEHLIETCAQLSDHFLHACPNLKIITSSREALGINGETVYRVPSLSLPQDLEDLRDVGNLTHDLMRYEATRLFSERAIKANPQFTLTKTMLRMWPKSANDWTAFHWRSSWLRRASNCSRLNKLRNGSTTASNC
ncbi:MAG TPA: hypothetical protein VF918_14550, partial [Anaerolineales bacterium]